MNVTLKEYQKEALEIMAFMGGRCINGMPTGSGKTLTSLYFFIQSGINCIIICPSNLKENWENELYDKFMTKSFVIKKSSDFDKIDNSYNFIICSYNLAVEFYKNKNVKKQILSSGKYQGLIVDESSKLISLKSKRTVSVKTISKYCKYITLLSATPLNSDIVQLYPSIKIINNEIFKDKVDFYNKLQIERDKFGNPIAVTQKSIDLLKSIISGIYFTFDKNTILPELPKKTRKILYYDIDKKKYDNIIKESLLTESHLTATSYIKKNIAEEMVDNVVKYTKELVQNTTKKVIIYTAYKQICTKIYNELQDVAVIYNGDISKNKRSNIKNSFIVDDKRVLIATIQSLAFGVDGLQYASDTVLFCDTTYVPFELFQAEDRIYRIGSQSSISIIYFAFRKTYHERLFSILREKWNIHNDLFTNSKRSLDYDVFNSVIGE